MLQNATLGISYDYEYDITTELNKMFICELIENIFRLKTQWGKCVGEIEDF
jgi:hypothetical protein